MKESQVKDFMDRYRVVTSRVVVLPVNDIDTDQIIPARFLKVTDKTGLGVNLFSNWRYQADGSPKPDFILNQPENKDVQILLSGNNFGCGSSREHAPWALLGFGFKAIISTSFADIFKNNSLKNGLLPIVVDTMTYQQLLEYFTANKDGQLTVDLEHQTIQLSDGRSFSFPIDGFSRTCLLNGVDELGYLLKLDGDISKYEQTHLKI